MGSVRQMLMLVTKLFLLLNLVVAVYPMTEAEFKIIIHFHQDNNSAAAAESDYIVDEDNQADANGVNSSPHGSSWTTRSEKCGDYDRPCENCGYYDCKESEKCKWSSGSGNGKWTPHGPYGVCKPRDEDKCGDNNLPCKDCGYYDCQESEKCKRSSGVGNGKWTPHGPYGFCKPRDEDKCEDCEDCGYYDCKESEHCKWSAGRVCKPRDDRNKRKCGFDIPCSHRDCTKKICQQSTKCKWDAWHGCMDQKDCSRYDEKMCLKANGCSWTTNWFGSYSCVLLIPV